MHDERELATRPKKVARMEFQGLLLGEVPTREFGRTMGMFMLQSILHLRSVGVALLGLAHLVTLKEYDRAFLQKASAKYPAGSGLRAPNSVELEWADKQLWGEIASLLEKGWTFYDSVHEVVHVSSSIQSYLQPRPVAASVPPALSSGRSRQGRLGCGQELYWSWSRRQEGVAPLLQVRAQVPIVLLAKSGLASVNALCACFGIRESVDLENCQYEHLCCVAANGKPCLGNHRAYEHKATPH